jgi:hypothetical protein
MISAHSYGSTTMGTNTLPEEAPSPSSGKVCGQWGRVDRRVE